MVVEQRQNSRRYNSPDPWRGRGPGDCGGVSNQGETGGVGNQEGAEGSDGQGGAEAQAEPADQAAKVGLETRTETTKAALETPKMEQTRQDTTTLDQAEFETSTTEQKPTVAKQTALSLSLWL